MWNTPEQPSEKRKGGGLFGGGGREMSTRDYIAIALSSLGDSIGEHTNGIKGQSLNGLMKRFQDQRDQAAKQEEEQRLIQVAKAAGYGDNQAPAVVAGMSLPQVEKPTNLQREHEYLKEIDPKRAEGYLDRNTDNSMYRQGADGQFYRVEKGGQSAPTAPVGKLTPIPATMENTPKPELGQNGQPQVLTRQQYQATVNAMGQQRTDDWVRKYNIPVGN